MQNKEKNTKTNSNKIRKHIIDNDKAVLIIVVMKTLMTAIHIIGNDSNNVPKQRGRLKFLRKTRTNT